jgi:fluoride exporter
VVVVVALGGALGAVLRWCITETTPSGDGFPWSTFAINVSGTFVLALLPAVAAVRRRPALAAGLGPGVCGGYTTLSAYSEQARALLADGRTATAGLYVVGTLAACLVVAALGTHWSTRAQRAAFTAEGGDE